VAAGRSPQPKPSAVGRQQGQNNDGQFGKFMHSFPVVRKKQNDAQAEKDCADAEKDNSAPGRSLVSHLITAFYVLGLINGNQSVI